MYSDHKGGVGKTTTTINLGDGFAAERLQGAVNRPWRTGKPDRIAGLVGRTAPNDLQSDERRISTVDIPAQGRYECSAFVPGLVSGRNGTDKRSRAWTYPCAPYQREQGEVRLYPDRLPPSLSLLTLNTLTASDHLIIPVQAPYLTMRGMAKLMQIVSKV